MNLTCGRNPWKQACPTDETFRAYLSNPDFLRSILPISKQCNELLKGIFALNPATRIGIKELKEQVKRMGRWTMTFDELKHATRATKEAARAWAPAHILDDPSTPDAPAIKSPPQPQAHRQQEPPKPVKVRDVFSDDSTASSAPDSLQEWRRCQQEQQQLQQQYKRQQARQQYASPVIASPVTSPGSSIVYEEQPSSKQTTPTTAKAPQNIRSNFSLSDSDTSSDDDDMEYAGRSQPYTPTKAQAFHATPSPQSPNPNAFSARSNFKGTPPPPLGTHSPRTPRQLFAAAQNLRQRKQSIESTSSSSSASSDASWTGLPPTPDTPIFAKRQTGADGAQEKGSPRNFHVGTAKLNLAF